MTSERLGQNAEFAGLSMVLSSIRESGQKQPARCQADSVFTNKSSLLAPSWCSLQMGGQTGKPKSVSSQSDPTFSYYTPRYQRRIATLVTMHPALSSSPRNMCFINKWRCTSPLTGVQLLSWGTKEVKHDEAAIDSLGSVDSV